MAVIDSITGRSNVWVERTDVYHLSRHQLWPRPMHSSRTLIFRVTEQRVPSSSATLANLSRDSCSLSLFSPQVVPGSASLVSEKMVESECLFRQRSAISQTTIWETERSTSRTGSPAATCRRQTGVLFSDKFTRWGDIMRDRRDTFLAYFFTRHQFPVESRTREDSSYIVYHLTT